MSRQYSQLFEAVTAAGGRQARFSAAMAWCLLVGITPAAAATPVAVPAEPAPIVAVNAGTAISPVAQQAPSVATALDTVAAATDSPAAVSAGGLLGTGDNVIGELGTGEIGNEANYWQAGDAVDWKAAASGTAFGCGLRQVGTLWCWGSNGRGQLGLGGGTRTTPTRVGTDTWQQVAAGDQHVCAIKGDQTLWCWGSGSRGELGTGINEDRGIPVQVSGGGQWSTVVAGDSFTCALRAAGSLWCWGAGSERRPNLVAPRGRPVPTQIGSDSSWTALAAGSSHACAIRGDSALACWGENGSGQLGTHDLNRRSAPSMVWVWSGSWWTTGWKQISAGYSNTCGVAKVGSLWCWGAGYLGQNGDGTRKLRPYAVRVGAADDWQSVTVGRNAACAKKHDSTLWCWGYNAQGQLGTGDHGDRLAPAQVTTPAAVSAMGSGPMSDRMFAISQDLTPVNACTETATTKTFANIGDLADYFPAPGGGFEGDLSDWQLTNAAAVDGNETLGYSSGSRSLKLSPTGAGAQAVSPAFCINERYPTFRYLVKPAAGTATDLRVALRFRPKNNPGYTIDIGSSTHLDQGDGWAVSQPSPLATAVARALLRAGGTVQLVFSVPAGRAAVLVDNVQIDPYRRG